MIYVLEPTLTGHGQNPTYQDLIDQTIKALDVVGRTTVSERMTPTVATDLVAEDALIFINPPVGIVLDARVLDLLRRAHELDIPVFPIGTTRTTRLPPVPVNVNQSFDIEEFQTQRNHASSYVAPAANEIARRVLGRMLSTCFVGKQSFFVAHRRTDGETLARSIGNELQKRGHDVFRDLGNVTVGDQAQKLIDANLDSVDCVLFLDTPEVGESKFTMDELRSALATRTPIVWVRFGDGADRCKLVVQPTGEPHISRDTTNDTEIADLAEQIVGVAHELSLSMVADSMTIRRSLQDFHRRNQAVVEPVDRAAQIYQVQIPRRTLDLPERPLTHICQFFGRRPTSSDQIKLDAWLTAKGMDEEPRKVDAAVVMDPRPGQHNIQGWKVHISADKYLEEIGAGKPSGASIPPQLLISGSFPSPSSTHSEIIRAVGDVAAEWLNLGGGIVFGGHPTFTPLIVGAVRNLHPLNPQSYATMYQSEFFADLTSIEASALHLSVVSTRNEGDRARSLTLMRRKMMASEGIAAMVVIGGRTDNRGVREEIEIGRSHGFPILPLASPGGEAAEVVNELNSNHGWDHFAAMPLSGQDTKSLCQRTDYRGIVRDLHRLLDS